jgi:hypothetical protein
MNFKNMLPVLQFTDDVVLEDPDAAAVFDRRLGQRVSRNISNRDDLAEYARRRYWYFIRTGRDNARCPGHQRVVTKLYFDILNDETLNAGATTWNEYNIIGANRGAIANIFTFFYLLLSQPNVLPDYGFPSEEVPWILSLAGCDWRGPLGLALSRITIDKSLADRPMTPKDWFRQSIADTLATMALDFLFFHEIAHLRRGHLQFIREQTGVQKIDEARFVGPPELRRARQAFELDADGGAMEVALTPWLKGRHVKGFQTDEAGPDEAIELWAFAIAFLFFLFDPFPQPIAAYRDEDHPHPAVRLLHLYLQASHVAQTNAPHALKRFQDTWWRALESVGVVSLQFNLPSSVMYSLHKESFATLIEEQQRTVGHLMNLVNEHESLKLS